MLVEARQLAHENSADINSLLGHAYENEWIKEAKLDDRLIRQIADRLFTHYLQNRLITEMLIGYRGDAVVYLSALHHDDPRIVKFIPYYDMPFDYRYGESVNKSERNFNFFRGVDRKGVEFPLVIEGKYICTLHFSNFRPQSPDTKPESPASSL